jgi:hypothetical protein
MDRYSWSHFLFPVSESGETVHRYVGLESPVTRSRKDRTRKIPQAMQNDLEEQHGARSTKIKV